MLVFLLKKIITIIIYQTSWHNKQTIYSIVIVEEKSTYYSLKQKGVKAVFWFTSFYRVYMSAAKNEYAGSKAVNSFFLNSSLH